MITNLIEPCMRKMILNHLTGNNCPEFLNGLLSSYFYKLTLESGFLEFYGDSRFQSFLRSNASEVFIEKDALKKCSKCTAEHSCFKKYQSFLNQNFKHNQAHIRYLNVTNKLSFEPRFSMLNTNSYYTKSKHLYSLDSLLNLPLPFPISSSLPINLPQRILISLQNC